MTTRRIKLLVVDDSAVVRQAVSGLLARDPEIEVMAAVADPLLAMERMKQQWPDVLLLDVEMPRMDGITFLKKIMAERPTPVIICSTLTEQGAKTTLAALTAGAVAIITKPKLGLKAFLHDSSNEIASAVKTAARANVKRLLPSGAGTRRAPGSAPVRLEPAAGHAPAPPDDRVVAIGASTGGTQALEAVLSALPRACPGIVLVQHMPEKFTTAFAARLEELCKIAVREAQNGDRVLPGVALLAPGGKHMRLTRSGAHYSVEVLDGPLVNRHRPSVNVLFRSVAKVAGKSALGVIMTGMGDDGAAGLLEMRNAGARTVAQDEDTCVVYGMPKEAVKCGAVEKSVPLSELSREILFERHSAS
jgi:two-component system, chemotaxis family, protein-glutamate methylesterase/glutaminase